MTKTPATVGGMPVFPSYAVLLGALWVLRKIEIAWAVWGDLVFDDGALKISWTLPVSKTDPQAKACTRSWSSNGQRQ